MPELREIEPTWIPPEKNPFHMRIFDCRPFTRYFTALTGNPEVAKSFSLLRHSDGRERRGRMPEACVAVPCRLIYKLMKNVPDGVVFRAREMEEKWDVDLFEDKLYLSRSWTGTLIMVAHLQLSAKSLTISEVNAKVSSHGDSTMIVRDVDFLIKTLLLEREVPHSLPPGLPSTEKAIVIYSHSNFGRQAAFATYEDTTTIAV